VEAGEELTLAEALGSLREQLLDAVDRAQGADLELICQGVEVELQVTVSTTVKGEGKVGLWSVVTIGAGADHASGYGHRVKLNLLPQFKGSTKKLAMSDDD
jgi:hypothetical protein